MIDYCRESAEAAKKKINMTKEDLIETLEAVEHEKGVHDYCLHLCDEKLIELLGPEEYGKWSIETAKKLIEYDAETLPDGEFKGFVKGLLSKNIK